jgi:uncharacterized membrane-anchored protein
MIKSHAAGLLLLLLPAITFAQSETETSTEQEQYWDWAKKLWDTIDRQSGIIEIKEANAVLNVPDNFYFLNSQDAEKVLVEIWGNPPGQTTLGMLFPADSTPFDDSAWAVTIDYEEDGYVSDDDADEIDYDELLNQLKDDAEASSKQRIEQGFESIELIGWAAPPYYDSSQKKLHWAKEYKFGDSPVNTLNYNIRVLGRKGVLLLNFIAGIDQKPIIETNISTVMALAEFDQGSQYSDFDPDIDTIAGYGLGALVAGKVIAKTGFIAAAIIFLKKFGIIFIIGIGMFLKKLFSKRKP